MKMPPPSTEAVRLFHTMVPDTPGVAARQMFGQPCAFVHGNMFFGVYGGEIFVRLSEGDCSDALRDPSFHLFEPMAGRPMKEYVVLPASVTGNPATFRTWVDRSVRYAARLPPKSAKRKSPR
jgi:TfoX/Sxy family transcriptional regulator of competence genes